MSVADRHRKSSFGHILGKPMVGCRGDCLCGGTDSAYILWHPHQQIAGNAAIGDNAARCQQCVYRDIWFQRLYSHNVQYTDDRRYLLCGIQMLGENKKRIKEKPAKPVNNGIPKGLLSLWRRGVRGEAEPPLKSSPASKATLDGWLAALAPA